MSTIFIIEDISEIANLIAMYLKKAQMMPRIFGTAEEALQALDGKEQPDLIILDLNLPGMSGFDCLKKLREECKISAPVVILSARDADEDIIQGLGLGADEFVTKPFSPRVLVARVLSHLRRQAAGTETGGMASERQNTIHFGEYTLLLDSYLLKLRDKKVPLSNKEFAVLECLCQHHDETLTPERIYKEVWGEQYGDLTAVAVYVKRLRQKIEADAAHPVFIKTVYGQGYMFALGGGGV